MKRVQSTSAKQQNMQFLISAIHSAHKGKYYKIQQEVHALVMKYLRSELQPYENLSNQCLDLGTSISLTFRQVFKMVHMLLLKINFH